MKRDVFEIYAKTINKGEMSIVKKQNSFIFSCHGTVKGKIQNNTVISASQYTKNKHKQ